MRWPDVSKQASPRATPQEHPAAAAARALVNGAAPPSPQGWLRGLLRRAVEHTVSVVDSRAERYDATTVTGELRSHDFRLSNGTVLTVWQVSVIRASWLVLDVEVSSSYRLYTAAPEARRAHAALSAGEGAGVW